jgi:hypothetical protein
MRSPVAFHGRGAIGVGASKIRYYGRMTFGSVTGILWVVVGCLAGQTPTTAPSPTALADHARTLALQSRAVGPATDAGVQYAREASRWAIRAVGALLARDEPSDDESGTVAAALEACDAVIPDTCLLEGPRTLRQSRDSLCAIASTRMLLAAWGYSVSEADLVQAAGPQALTDGVHVSFLLECLPHYGLSTLACEGDSRMLRVALAAGLPVAVHQWVTPDRAVRHMRVVAGYDRSDPEKPRWRVLEPAPQLPEVSDVADDEFQRLWELPWDDDRHVRWMCLAYDRVEGD